MGYSASRGDCGLANVGLGERVSGHRGISVCCEIV